MTDKSDRWKKTMLAKLSIELGREATQEDLTAKMKAQASKGGKAKYPNKGFARLDKEEHARVSALGGKAKRKK